MTHWGAPVAWQGASGCLWRQAVLSCWRPFLLQAPLLSVTKKCSLPGSFHQHTQAAMTPILKPDFLALTAPPALPAFLSLLQPKNSEELTVRGAPSPFFHHPPRDSF